MQSLWMLLAAALFSLMGVCVKLASNLFSTSEIVFYRGLFGAVLLGIWMLCTGRSLRTDKLVLHLKRGAVGVISLWLWFFAIGALPVATAMTLNYTAPIFLAVILILFAKKTTKGLQTAGTRVFLLILLSFVGVIMMLRPRLDLAYVLPGLIGLASGLFAAFALLQVKALGATGESEVRVVFYFSVFVTLASAISLLIEGRWLQLSPITGKSGLILLGIGGFATLAQVSMTRAYSRGKTLLTANLQYSGVICSSLLGIWIFHDLLHWVSWLGMAVIIASSVLATIVMAQPAPQPKTKS